MSTPNQSPKLQSFEQNENTISNGACFGQAVTVGRLHQSGHFVLDLDGTGPNQPLFRAMVEFATARRVLKEHPGTNIQRTERPKNLAVDSPPCLLANPAALCIAAHSFCCSLAARPRAAVRREHSMPW